MRRGATRMRTKKTQDGDKNTLTSLMSITQTNKKAFNLTQLSRSIKTYGTLVNIICIETYVYLIVHMCDVKYNAGSVGDYKPFIEDRWSERTCTHTRLENG